MHYLKIQAVSDTKGERQSGISIYKYGNKSHSSCYPEDAQTRQNNVKVICQKVLVKNKYEDVLERFD